MDGSNSVSHKTDRMGKIERNIKRRMKRSMPAFEDWYRANGERLGSFDESKSGRGEVLSKTKKGWGRGALFALRAFAPCGMPLSDLAKRRSDVSRGRRVS